jgi:type VI secretion system protein ImpB
LTKLDGNDELDQLLQDVVASTESMEEIKTLYGGEESAAAPEEPDAEEDKEEKKKAPKKKDDTEE